MNRSGLLRNWVAAAVIGCLLLPGLSARRVDGSQHSVHALYSEYVSQGALPGGSISGPFLLTLPDPLRQAVGNWPPKQAAAFALELASAAYAAHAEIHQVVLVDRGLAPRQRQDLSTPGWQRLAALSEQYADVGYDLLEVGCRVLRSASAVEADFELAWTLAADAMLAATGEPSWLGPSKGGQDMRRHLAHMNGRLPQAVLKSLEAATFEQVAWWIATVDLPVALSGRQSGDERYLDQLRGRLRASAASATALLAPTAGEFDTEVRTLVMALLTASASARPGVLARLESLPLAAPAHVRYIAAAVRGLELERDGDLTGAIAAYRTAVEANPGAQRSLMALSVILAVSGEHDEAATMVASAIAAKNSFDPLDYYGRSAQAEWSHRLQEVRRRAGLAR